MSKPQPIKQGYMRKYGKAILVDPWKKVFVQLDSNGTIYWYKKKKSSSSGQVKIAKVCEFFTMGSYCRAIPFSPALPSDGRLENMFAFPEEPKKKSKIHFFLCDSDYDFNEWISAIVSFFPTATNPNSQQPTMPISHSPYSPVPVTQYPVVRPQGPTLGFEGLSISGNSRPQNNHPGYPPTQSYQQPYPSQPLTYPHHPPGAPYHPPAALYPQQQPYYPQGGFYQGGMQTGSYPAYQSYPPQQPTYPYAQHSGAMSYVQPTIVVKEKTKSSPGYGKMAAGVLGGAVAGYAASRMFGGWGGWGLGRGWGHGSWGSCSWSSRSWGSFSSCSWGSFG